ncbi:NUDIX domain-containing protein [Sphingobacterium sp. BIGb0116]|uniref:NUDIX hydrolase n=1 Tax=Sphingobacterium sp. BIGb0116 TaxID=2940619 RepID=UPI0021671184|nr:NUDIX domain-containing protein [Sphingobacterium sp. BIGb0116]MCS4164529.1 8-oxo-dGTP pyrophosphatase MutT (NUDIX family) [Sphingobacterium sp. BIGb0116]
MQHKIIDKVALISIKDRKILSTRSKTKTKFYFPGGKRENNESDITCLKREILEELSVHIVEESMRLLGTFEAIADGRNQGTLVRMICYFSDFEGVLHPANEIETFEWLTYKDKHRTSAVDQIIFHRLKEMNLID